MDTLFYDTLQTVIDTVAADSTSITTSVYLPGWVWIVICSVLSIAFSAYQMYSDNKRWGKKKEK